MELFTLEDPIGPTCFIVTVTSFYPASHPFDPSLCACLQVFQPQLQRCQWVSQEPEVTAQPASEYNLPTRPSHKSCLPLSVFLFFFFYVCFVFFLWNPFLSVTLSFCAEHTVLISKSCILAYKDRVCASLPTVTTICMLFKKYGFLLNLRTKKHIYAHTHKQTHTHTSQNSNLSALSRLCSLFSTTPYPPKIVAVFFLLR